MKQNLHTHTCYCDGKDTPEAIVQAAVAQGFDSIGFSGHAHTVHDESYCMSREDTNKYYKNIISLRNQYADQIRIYAGIEQDYFSDPISHPWDYVIGSVHYLLADGVFIPVDEDRETLERAAAEHFEGDIYSLIANYFKMVTKVVQITGCDIIGHFDLISKFNEDGTLFDPNHPDYMVIWSRTLDTLFAGADVGPFWTGLQRTGASANGTPIFEINTGAIARGYRSAPYPSIDMLRSICAREGRIMFTSDAHDKEQLDYGFDLARDMAKEAGFTEETILTEHGFEQIPLYEGAPVSTHAGHSHHHHHHH